MSSALVTGKGCADLGEDEKLKFKTGFAARVNPPRTANGPRDNTSCQTAVPGTPRTAALGRNVARAVTFRARV